MVGEARAIKRRWRRFACRSSSTIASTWRSPPRPTACIWGLTTWRSRTLALLGRDAIVGLSIKSVAEPDVAPLDLIDYVGSGGVYVTLSKQQKNPPIGPQGLTRIIAALHRRVPNLPVVGIAASTPAMPPRSSAPAPTASP